MRSPGFTPHISARQNLELSAAARDAQAHARVDSCLARCGLLERSDERVRNYSLGMRQRLGLARCLLGDPQLLILDEPTNGLDPAGVAEFRHFVRGLVDEGRTVFISTHILDEIEKICDGAAVVHEGRVVANGSIAELTAAGGHSRLIVESDRPAEALAAVTDLIETHRLIKPDTLELLIDPQRVTPAGIIHRLVEAGIEIRRVDQARQSLEETFLQLTASRTEGT